MEFPNVSSPLELNIDFPLGLHEDILTRIFKLLKNVRDIAQVRRVCSYWYQVATPIFLAKIDEIEINLCVNDKKGAMYRRILFEKYQEKQREISNQKLSQIDTDVVYNEATVTAEIPVGSVDESMSLISSYCDYIKSGGTIKYTNFNFSDINIEYNQVVSRFFALCGEDVTTLTLTIPHDNNYWFCDEPSVLCNKCYTVDLQSTKQVWNRSRLKQNVLQYCPNLNILTLIRLPSPKNQNEESSNIEVDGSDDDNDDDNDEDSIEEQLRYANQFGNIGKQQPDELWPAVIEEPPTTKIHTIRINDELVVNYVNTMLMHNLFTLCPKLVRVSNFGLKKTAFTTAFESLTFDFVRQLVSSKRMETIEELSLRHLDSTIIGTLLRRHKNSFRLKFLKVNFLVSHMVETTLLQFLESQSPTLETFMCGLTQKKNPRWSNDQIRFPKQMPKLTHLRVGLGTQKQNILRPPKQVAPIDWAKQFPSLKTLMLPERTTNVTIASFFEHPKAVEPLATVTEIELPAGLTANLMKRAGFLFPNVIQLAVGYQTAISLRQIWSMWPKLESLHLSVVDDNEHRRDIAFLSLDALLTGFDEEQMKIAKHGHHYVIGEPIYPSITNLKHLRELTIYGAPYRTHIAGFHRVNWKNDDNDAVTDISVIHALGKLKSLKYLDISDHLHNISPKVDQEFCNYMNLFHEDNVNFRKNFTVMSHYRGREEAHPMCRKDAAYNDK